MRQGDWCRIEGEGCSKVLYRYFEQDWQQRMESTGHTMFLDYYNLLEAAQKAPRAAARACCKSSVKSREVAAKIGETLDCRRSAQKKTDFFESCLLNILPDGRGS